MIDVIGVTFKNTKRVYYFDPNNLNVITGQKIIVQTEKGEQLGEVELENHQIESSKINKELKKAIRTVTEADLVKHAANIEGAKKALLESREIVKKHGLKMHIITSEYTFNKEKLMFKFLADDRIDFRELVKELASKYHTRIELFQIGVRDKAKEVGGLGQCGLILCCHKFLNDFDTVSINMAKNQSIALNPSKINGQCGRLLCCLKYEDDCYKECKKNMPRVGGKYMTPEGEGKISSVNIFDNSIRVYVKDFGIVEVKL